jgi:hypothetical protein
MCSHVRLDPAHEYPICIYIHLLLHSAKYTAHFILLGVIILITLEEIYKL